LPPGCSCCSASHAQPRSSPAGGITAQQQPADDPQPEHLKQKDKPMPPAKRTRSTRKILPPHQPREHQAVQGSLATLRNWREGSVATAIVMAALLPFAVAWHLTYLTATAACLIGAATLAAGCHVIRQHKLATLAVIPELAQLPEFATKHKQLLSARKRQALAAGLRRTAALTQPPRRFDTCPILTDRVAAVRPELLQLADALEQTNDLNPASVALIHELLTNACSPLYNPNLPTERLHATISQAHAGIPLRPTAEPPAPRLHAADHAAHD
jgi:hypothetical protein